jgi:integrase
MINRGNWVTTKSYLKFRKEIDHLSHGSLRYEEGLLRHLLEWADECSFKKINKVRPSFPQYMVTARLDNSENPLSRDYVKKSVGTARRFLTWLSINKRGYGNLTQGWLSTLKPPRMVIEPKDHEAITIEEVRAIAKAPITTLRERRIQAAAVFWFLSGIRIGAFVSLPIKSINLEALEVRQWPSLGVNTKFNKHATTFLLDIPDLLEVVNAWDYEVRKNLFDDNLWFARISTETESFEPDGKKAGNHRQTRARKDLKAWLERVDLPYYSPHKFRHGHAVYSLKLANTISDLKAISMNLMHSDLKITDGVYAILSDTDVKEKISNLNKIKEEENISTLLEEILREIKSKKG